MINRSAYVAYSAKYDEPVIKTFILSRDGVVYAKNLGKDTGNVAKSITEFNPDQSWTDAINVINEVSKQPTINVLIGACGWKEPDFVSKLFNMINDTCK